MADEQKKEQPKKKTDDSVILVGERPFMNYVTAVVMQFNIGAKNEVAIKSRGKFMSKAIDIEEVVRHRFLSDVVELKNVKIESESFTNKEGRVVRVSTLELVLAKKAR